MTRTEKYASLRAYIRVLNTQYKLSDFIPKEDEDDALEEWEEEDE